MMLVGSSAVKQVSSVARESLFLTPGKWAMVLGGVLLLAVLVVYYPAGHYTFTNADDDSYISDNAHVRSGLEWDTVRWAFTTFRAGNWHPLTWLSHALDVHLYFLDPGKHHRTSVLLHASNAILLFWVLLRATGCMGRSAMVAALFALHPINVESVVWISERKNVLSMLFFLLALAAYRWYALKPRVGLYSVVALLYALGLMCKPQVITFPFVLLLWDYWPLWRMFVRGEESSAMAASTRVPAQGFSWLVLEKLPLFMLSAASAVLTVKAQRFGGAMSGPLNTYPFPLRFENAIVSYVRYIGKALWPSQLAFLYPHLSFAVWQVGAGLLLLLVISGMVIASHQRYLAMGWFWFLGTSVPMIGLVQVGSQAMADRYAYLPLVGLFIMICWGLPDWADQHGVPANWLIVPSFAAVVALALVTHRQIGYWSNNVSLWAHTVQVTRRNWIAEDNLGAALMHEGKIEEAIVHFRTAEGIYPSDPRTPLFIGFYEQKKGRLREAIEQYKKVISLTQNDIWNNAQLRDDAFVNMGYAYRDLGDHTHARESFAAAENQRRDFLRQQQVSVQ
jgi:protein O-mannosyl-transferase